jgi:hypothetical protein
LPTAKIAPNYWIQQNGLEAQAKKSLMQLVSATLVRGKRRLTGGSGAIFIGDSSYS